MISHVMLSVEKNEKASTNHLSMIDQYCELMEGSNVHHQLTVH